MAEDIKGVYKIIKTVKLREGCQLSFNGKILILHCDGKRYQLDKGRPEEIGHFLCGLNFGLTNPHLTGE